MGNTIRKNTNTERSCGMCKFLSKEKELMILHWQKGPANNCNSLWKHMVRLHEGILCIIMYVIHTVVHMYVCIWKLKLGTSDVKPSKGRAYMNQVNRYLFRKVRRSYHPRDHSGPVQQLADRDRPCAPRRSAPSIWCTGGLRSWSCQQCLCM